MWVGVVCVAGEGGGVVFLILLFFLSVSNSSKPRILTFHWFYKVFTFLDLPKACFSFGFIRVSRFLTCRQLVFHWFYKGFDEFGHIRKPSTNL